MTTIGVFNIINKNNKVLLVKRRDLPLWDLPGGGLEANESFEDCLVRETIEETGIVVEPFQEVGHFINVTRDDEQIIYSSMVVGGKPIKNGPETKALKYFSINALPINIIPHRKKQIRQAYNSSKDLKIEYLKDPLIVSLIRKIV